MGELARPPDAPMLPATPLELMKSNEEDHFTWMDKNLTPIVLGSSGVICRSLYNRFMLRPPWAGIQYHLLFGLSFYWIGKKVQEIRLESRLEKDAILRHYISLHPEDFPPYERRRIKDIFAPWYPIR